jgi:hypothetical protein
MREEHFGMAVAELVRGGSIVFVPRGGGQREIIGGEDRLLYGTAAEAAEKITRVLSSPHLQSLLREHLVVRRELFSMERFTRQIQALVRNFAAKGAEVASMRK